MHKHKKVFQTAGFTIVELLIVVVVIAILATVSIVTYTNIQDRARNSIVAQNLSNTVKAIEMFNVENGRYPANTADYTKVKSGLVLTETKSNILLYCVDSSNPTSWALLAARYPTKSSLWNSAGLRDDASNQVVGSGQITCQAIFGDSSSSVGGAWAFQFAVVQ